MIDPVLISKYQDLNQRVDVAENRIREILEGLARPETIVSSRPMDYGQRGFNLNIIFDEINPNAFEGGKIEELRLLFTEYTKVRIEQCRVEEKVNLESQMKKQISDGLRQV